MNGHCHSFSFASLVPFSVPAAFHGISALCYFEPYVCVNLPIQEKSRAQGFKNQQLMHL
jgi:hypothetical protein